MNNQTHRGSMPISEIVIICLALLTGIAVVVMFWVGHLVLAFALIVIVIAAITTIHHQNSMMQQAGTPPGKRRR